MDSWAGLGLTGQRFLPLARQLFSRRPPQGTSQHAVAEAVLAHALDLLHRLERPALVLGAKGRGRTDLIMRLAPQEQDAVLRVAAAIMVYPPAAPDGLLRAAALARPPWRGALDGDRGAEAILRCRLRTRRAPLRFSRTGRKDDVQEATVTFVEAVPGEGATASLGVATPLPVDTGAQVRALVRLDAPRWAIATGFATMHAWGQEAFRAFRARRGRASARLLWVLAVASARVIRALSQRTLRTVRRQATAVLTALSGVGDPLTLGTLAAAISLDYPQHRRACSAAWVRCGLLELEPLGSCPPHSWPVPRGSDV